MGRKAGPPKIAKGTPRKSIEQKKLEGTYRKDRDSAREVPMVGAVAYVDPPELTGAAAKHWADTVPYLCGLGVIFPQDVPSLYQAFDLLEEVQRMNGPRDDDEAGPTLSDKLQCIKLYNSIMAAFLVSPRERLKAAALFAEHEKAGKSSADKLMGDA